MDEIWNGACGIAWIMDHDGSLITMVTLSMMEHIAIEDIEHDVDRKRIFCSTIVIVLLCFCFFFSEVVGRHPSANTNTNTSTTTH